MPPAQLRQLVHAAPALCQFSGQQLARSTLHRHQVHPVSLDSTVAWWQRSCRASTSSTCQARAQASTAAGLQNGDHLQPAGANHVREAALLAREAAVLADAQGLAAMLGQVQERRDRLSSELATREAALAERERAVTQDAQQLAQRMASIHASRTRLLQHLGLDDAAPDVGAEESPDLLAYAGQEPADSGVQSLEDAELQGVAARPLPSRAEMQRRHAILGNYIKGRNWGLNEEARLVRRFVLDLHHPVRARYPWLFDFEWVIVLAQVEGHLHGHYGRGDLVFTDGADNFLVVEAKYLQSTSGRTSKVSRTSKRRLVREQVVSNVEACKRQWTGWASVKGVALTNENYDELQLDS